MIPAEHDAKWWQRFTVAPPELQRAMHATLRARETLELRSGRGTDDAGLAEYEQRVAELEQTEQRIREAVHRRRSEVPLPRTPGPRTPRPREAPEATRTRAGVGAGPPTAPGPDHYW